MRSYRDLRTAFTSLSLLVLSACSTPGPETGLPRASAATESRGVPYGPVTQAQVARGRLVVLQHDCGACHGGMVDPSASGWLAGKSGADDAERFGEFRVWPRNLTPDAETGTGRYSERQIFNALRYGLRPASTPDLVVTSAVPGTGGHPENADYLAPGMPWMFWRYMPEEDLWAIAAYLKHGLAPVAHRVPEREGPREFWASLLPPIEQLGEPQLPPFPTGREQLADPARREAVLRGRALVAGAACSGCHGRALRPDQEGWLSGITDEEQASRIGEFRTRARNITPDNATGIGRFSERQLFNSLRWGLRPGETPDIEITSGRPGVGNHPAFPKYLAPPMPWPAWRHFSDQELRDIVAYLKHGVRPVANRVADSEGPPDFWASAYTDEAVGAYPAPAFPTSNERLPR